MRKMRIFAQVVIAIVFALISRAQEKSAIVPDDRGCVLKHIIYDERPTSIWLVYATKDGKEVQLLSTRKDIIKAAKDCRDYLKEERKNAGKSKDGKNTK